MTDIADAEKRLLIARKLAAGPRDWPEDFEHENGNYNCLCCVCGSQFTGHKRRVVCRLCSTQ